MLTVTSPYDGHIIAEIKEHSQEEALNALHLAHTLYLDEQRRLPAWERVAILEKLIGLMKGEVEALTRLAAEEGGKPYTDSRVEVERAINGVRLAIEGIAQLTGKEIPMNINKASANRLAVVTREPIGVVLSLSAFNHPLNLVVHQTVTAIAAGCPVVIKPASVTPLSCLRFAALLAEAGLPADWCQVIICTNEIGGIL